jgi:predicted unusual protein kinase regulating ubiquinone biosynthesis (AarF/ABC1/UbiB family)
LCQECLTTDFDELKLVLERTYKNHILNIFKDIEKEPLGSASLAQVHKAYLKDGTPVAIKVYILKCRLDILIYLIIHLEIFG